MPKQQYQVKSSLVSICGPCHVLESNGCHLLVSSQSSSDFISQVNSSRHVERTDQEKQHEKESPLYSNHSPQTGQTEHVLESQTGAKYKMHM